MQKLNIDSIIAISGRNSEENSWYRYNRTFPNILKENNNIILKNSECECIIGEHEESVLYTLLIFKFAPLWLVYKFLEKDKLSSRSSDDIISEWVKIGLVWIEPSVTGDYLRPTYLLFKIMNEKPQNFSDIPFNKLTHTISEIDVFFNVFSGQKDFIVNKKFHELYLPKYSPIGINKYTKQGTNIISESQFASVITYLNKDIRDINNIENEIAEEIKKGKSITQEFKDFSKFMLVNKIGNTEDIKKDYKFHVPDLIIPVPRTMGEPNSLAIEIELTNKGLKRYIDTLIQFKDNPKYGTLIWLSNSGKTTQNLKKAYMQIGGLGKTKMAIFEYTIPSPSNIFKL